MTRRGWWGLAIVIAALALAASGNSVTNRFTYDDVYILERSAARMGTLAGWWREFATSYWPAMGSHGDGYRPLTILGFKLQWMLAGGSPMPFHAVNIALHVVTAVAVFWLAGGVLPLAAAWIAAALYAVHPVHVEAIANVVGQSELIVALLVTVAMALYVHGRRAGPLSAGRWTVIGVLYAIGMLFKEHAITLIALLPLAELTVVADRTPLRARAERMRLPMLALLLVAVAYLWPRSLVAGGGTGFQPFAVFQALDLSHGDRILTMIGAAPEWLRLLVWPARLTTEYTPPYLEVAQGPSLAQLPGLLVLIGTLGLCLATWRRSPVTAFGIGWMVLTLLPASNFILPAGFIIAERTLLLPSVGAIIALASAVPWLYERVEGRRAREVATAALLVVVVALGIGRSVDRNRAWKDTETLLRRAIRDSPESYRAHLMLGGLMFERRNLTDGEVHVREAFRLFPHDPLIVWVLAEQYRSRGFCEPAIRYYETFLLLEPDVPGGHASYAACLLHQRRPDDARAAALRSLERGGALAPARRVLRASRRMRDSLDMPADSIAAARARADTNVGVP
ncbi:MAG: tetratricopeptide repeat protein [Gemmatimonadaceae bacterium]